MKLSKILFLGCLTCLVSVSSFASGNSSGGGPISPRKALLASCSGQLTTGETVTLQVGATATPNIKYAVLKKKNTVMARLYCEEGRQAPEIFNCGTTEWDKTGENADGFYVIKVVEGFAQIKSASISIAQTPPLPPEQVGLLSCR